MESSTRIFCIANQKGGVGKTTTAINLAACLAESGQRTLVVDLDPQCNATSGLGLEPVEKHPLLLEEPLRANTQSTAIENLFIVPGSRSFVDVDRLAHSNETESEQIAQHLANEARWYENILIDCPPSLGQLTKAALQASTEVLMPIHCEYFAMEGLTQMIHVIRDIMKSKRNKLTFGGILLTMYDPRLELTHEVDNEVREFFGDIVFDTVIPRDVALCEAPSHGQSVLDYAPRSRGARAYVELCMEVLNRD